MTRFLLVCLGGALGSGARYLVSVTLPRGTLLVNLAGSFAIALVMATMRESDLRLMIVAGVIGGFTTYSAFNEETLRMMRAGAWGMAGLDVALTVFGCLGAGYLGVMVARAFVGR